jgi:hypothetical protein
VYEVERYYDDYLPVLKVLMNVRGRSGLKIYAHIGYSLLDPGVQSAEYPGKAGKDC